MNKNNRSMQRLDRKAVTFFFLRGLFVVGLMLIVIAVLIYTAVINSTVDSPNYHRNNVLPYAILATAGAALVLAVITYLIARLNYRFYFYGLGKNSFMKEQGIINKRYTSIPYERIQDVGISRGLLERILGISTLKIQTAGGDRLDTASVLLLVMAPILWLLRPKSEGGVLPGLNKHDAVQVRDQLMNLSGGNYGNDTHKSSYRNSTHTGGL